MATHGDLPAPTEGQIRTQFITVRDVAAARRFYADATAKAAQFLTEPLDRKAELRCSLRDPDGHLMEVGQATGLLEGILADLPAGPGR